MLEVSNSATPRFADDPAAPDADWLIAYTKPRLEAQAQAQLEQQAFETYLPLFKKMRRTAAGPVSVFEPMFPRYLMFRPTRQEQSLSVVRSTRGVTSLVRFGVEPARLSNTVVETIRQLQARRDQATLDELSNLQAGQKVRLKHNALNGLEGLVQQVSSKRVAVLLEILGRPAQVQLEHHQVEPLV